MINDSPAIIGWRPAASLLAALKQVARAPRSGVGSTPSISENFVLNRIGPEAG
jgi:hypothetical protein